MEHKFPTGRTVLTGIVVVMSGILLSIASSMQSQYQGIVAASQVNNDSVAGNALAFWFRNADIVGFVGLLVVIGLLAWIWVPYFKALNTKNEVIK